MRCLLLPLLPGYRAVPRARQRSVTSLASTATALSTGDLSAVAHSLWAEVVRPGDTVVDATAGRGHDSLALARLALTPGAGRLLSLDVQPAAVLSTQQLLASELSAELLSRAEVMQVCHSTLSCLLPANSTRLVAFNLGYLPGESDKQVITKPEVTREALQAACAICRPGGLVSVMVYTGHPGGEEEGRAVEEFASSLPARLWTTSRHSLLNRAATCPFLVCLHRRPAG